MVRAITRFRSTRNIRKPGSLQEFGNGLAKQNRRLGQGFVGEIQSQKVNMFKLYLNWFSGKSGCSGLVKLGIAALLGFVATASWAAPANDNFANAIKIAGNNGKTNGATLGATLQLGEPMTPASAAGRQLVQVDRTCFGNH